MPPQGYAQDMSNQPNVHELRDVLNDVDFPVDKWDLARHGRSVDAVIGA